MKLLAIDERAAIIYESKGHLGGVKRPREVLLKMVSVRNWEDMFSVLREYDIHLFGASVDVLDCLELIEGKEYPAIDKSMFAGSFDAVHFSSGVRTSEQYLIEVSNIKTELGTVAEVEAALKSLPREDDFDREKYESLSGALQKVKELGYGNYISPMARTLAQQQGLTLAFQLYAIAMGWAETDSLVDGILFWAHKDGSATATFNHSWLEMDGNFLKWLRDLEYEGREEHHFFTSVEGIRFYFGAFTPYIIDDFKKVINGLIDPEGMKEAFEKSFSVYLKHYPNSEKEKEESIRLVAKNVLFQLLCRHLESGIYGYKPPTISESLYLEVSGNNNMHSLLWYELAKIVDAREEIKLCEFCNTPIDMTDRNWRRRKVCSDTCKSKSTNARRDKAFMLAGANVPFEDAVSQIGEAYRGSVCRWYEEARQLNTGQRKKKDPS